MTATTKDDRSNPDPIRRDAGSGMWAIFFGFAGVIVAGVLLRWYLLEQPPVSNGANRVNRPTQAPDQLDRIQLEKWAAELVEFVKDGRFYSRPNYSDGDFAKELAGIIQARGVVDEFRDHQESKSLSVDATLVEISRSPAAKALCALARSEHVVSFQQIDPTLFLRNLQQDGTFQAPSRGGIPETLAEFLPVVKSGNNADVILMRRRVRDRLDDLAAIANAAAGLHSSNKPLDRRPIMAWARDLERDALDNGRLAPGPRTLTLFSIADLSAAKVVKNSWPIDQLRQVLKRDQPEKADETQFDPFEPCNPSLSDGWSLFKDAAKRESLDLIDSGFNDKKGLEAVTSAIERFCRHEQTRETRIVQPDWPSE